jgi:hypothetical protein
MFNHEKDERNEIKYGKGVQLSRYFKPLAFILLSSVSSFSWLILPEFEPLQSGQATELMDSASLPLFVNSPQHFVDILVFLLTAQSIIEQLAGF